ncbi:hypothetical protein C8R44DRAFT_731974 [Mycena epipterygia]|nr:hypothetical protein C8R44DRAFT_731974 [Mycena epipterygia]
MSTHSSYPLPRSPFYPRPESLSLASPPHPPFSRLPFSHNDSSSSSAGNRHSSASSSSWQMSLADPGQSIHSRSTSSSSALQSPSLNRHSRSTLSAISGEELLQAGNQAYINLFLDRETLQARLDESRSNYNLLLSQINTSTNPGEGNAGDFPSNSSVLKLRSRDKFPGVKFWAAKDYNSKSSDVSSFGPDELDGDDDDTVSDKKFKGYPWVEDADGNLLSKSSSRALSSHLRTALNYIGNKARAPANWGNADLEVVQYVRSEMYTAYPDLRLCSHNWKLDQILTKVYPSWKRNWVKNGGLILKKHDEMKKPSDSNKPHLKKRKHESATPAATTEHVAKRAKSRETLDMATSNSDAVSPHLPSLMNPQPMQEALPTLPIPETPTASTSVTSPSVTSVTAPTPDSAPASPPESANAVLDRTTANPTPLPPDELPVLPERLPASVVNTPSQGTTKSREVFRGADLFSFGAPRTATSRVTSLNIATSANPSAAPVNGEAGPSTAPSEKRKRSKNISGPLKANATLSARNICIQDYLASRPGQAPTLGEFEVHWASLSDMEKALRDVYQVFDKRGKAEKKKAKNLAPGYVIPTAVHCFLTNTVICLNRHRLLMLGVRRRGRGRGRAREGGGAGEPRSQQDRFSLGMITDSDLEDQNIANIISPGLEIARKYYDKFDNTDAYIIAMFINPSI